MEIKRSKRTDSASFANASELLKWLIDTYDFPRDAILEACEALVEGSEYECVKDFDIVLRETWWRFRERK